MHLPRGPQRLVQIAKIKTTLKMSSTLSGTSWMNIISFYI